MNTVNTVGILGLNTPNPTSRAKEHVDQYQFGSHPQGQVLYKFGSHNRNGSFLYQYPHVPHRANISD